MGFPTPSQILTELFTYFVDEYELKRAVSEYRRKHECRNFIIAAHSLLQELKAAK